MNTYEKRVLQFDEYRQEERRASSVISLITMTVCLVCLVLLSGCSCSSGSDVFRSCSSYEEHDCKQQPKNGKGGVINLNCEK